MRKYYANPSVQMTELEKENQDAVMSLAGECMVLLENDGTLPLKLGKIALYGNGVRHTVKGGTGSGDVNSREEVNAQQGFETAGFEVTTKAWLEAYDERIAESERNYMEQVNRIAREKNCPNQMVMFDMPYEDPDMPEITEETVAESDTDTAVYILARNSGEGRDRRYKKGDYLLSDSEEAGIRFLAGHYRKFVVLLNTGGIIDTFVLKSIEGIGALMIVGQTGNMGGHVIASVVSGKTVPSGKLTDTWAAAYEDYPFAMEFGSNNGNVDDEYYREGIFVGYRYFDTFNVTPNYCFGYGKGYTDFEIKTVDVAVQDGTVKVKAEVKNIGNTYAGREVVQVYYTAPDGKLLKPYQELAAFEKTSLLAPGEQDEVTLSFPVEAMASYDEERSAYVLEEGNYLVRVGNSSRGTRVEAVLEIPLTVVTKQLKPVFPEGILGVKDELSAKGAVHYSYPAQEQEIREAKRIEILERKIPFRRAVYTQERKAYEDSRKDEILTLEDVQTGRASLEELTAQLTVEEMASLCVGLYELETGDVVGAASNQVPGAAGETVSSLVEIRKIPALILADGPAGLRLQPHFKTTREGRLLPGGKKRGMDLEPFPANTPKDAADYYQYCTAIPVASTLAQSWDRALLEEMGRIVGTEMKQFHIHLWLAPGMNIHRNPLCGRNFEYYSEDPLLSGQCAAAETKGVQAQGCQGTTIKHLALNNQEDNRMFNNAHVGERALREVYLKGFEIAVKEAQPFAIMTSYNLIGGIHAANHYPLLQSVCRDEWGFEGVFMTDWCTSQDTSYLGFASNKYPWSSSVQCIRAGNDLQMPGCEKNVADIIKAVKEGEEIQIGDLQFCAMNILRTILQCGGCILRRPSH